MRQGLCVQGTYTLEISSLINGRTNLQRKHLIVARLDSIIIQLIRLLVK